MGDRDAMGVGGMKDKKCRCRADSQGTPAAEEQSKGKKGRTK